jgi:hypothetical protein
MFRDFSNSQRVATKQNRPFIVSYCVINKSLTFLDARILF